MASSSQAASSSSSSSLGQSALYLCAKEDNNGVFRRTKKGFEDRIATAASSGLGSDCLVSESILAVESYIKNNYPNGLSRLYIRAHGDQTKGRGFSLTLKSTADGGVISLSTSGKQLKTLKRICQAVQPGGTLIVEGCYSGLGKNNLLKFLAGLCNPDVLVVGSKGSAFEVGFDPILNMHTRFTDVMTKKDLTRVYYTKSGKAQNIPIDQFNILWDFLRNKIAPDDSKTLQMAYRLCYQLLGERNNLEALVKIREENKDLIASLLQDPEDVRTDFKAMTFSKKDASPVWQEMLRELENASDVFNHHGEKEFPITPESKRGLIATSKGVSFHNHSTRYIAAYQFLLGCAAIEKHKTIGILYDNGDKRTIENPGAMIMHSVSDQTIHTDELSLTEILSKEFPRFKESYLLAKKHRSEEPGLVKEWLTKIIGPERGGCLDKYIERNYYFHLTRLNIDNTLGLKVAIQNNNLETFKRHLNSQADLNHVYADGRTILDIALQEGSSSIIAYLVLAFPEDRFPALMQDIQAKVNPIKKANTLYVIYKHLHKQGRIAEAQDLRDQVQRATEQVLIMKEASPDSLLKARMLNGASQVLEEIGDLVKAEHVSSKVFQTLI